MSLLIQVTDTHILPPGALLYGSIDTAAHLSGIIRQINAMQPAPDLVMITGDLVERADSIAYEHFIDLLEPLEIPAYVIPGNHDDPAMMAGVFADTPYFPARDETFQYAIEGLPFRVLALNSHCDGTELPDISEKRLSWLQNQLAQSDKPVLIAIHHPPMLTGIEFIDMAGPGWFQGLKSILKNHPQSRLVICGHSHMVLSGQIGNVPVYMAPASSHQLIAARGTDVAPSSVNTAAAPVLHHFIDGDFLSGGYPWPEEVEKHRIDKASGLSWSELKKNMRGSRA